MYYFDKNGELVDNRESVLESFGEDNDTELDLEDKILLFEAKDSNTDSLLSTSSPFLSK